MNAMLPPPAPLRILIVEDSPDDAELMQLALRRAGVGFTAARVETEAEFTSRLDVDLPDIVLCDFHLPRFSCARVLEILESRGLRVPVVVVSRHISPSEAEETMRRGANACLMKDSLSRLASTVSAVLGEAASR